MYAGIDYSVSDVGESEIYGLDFVNDLSTGDSITSVQFTMSVSDNSPSTDPNPAGHLDGLPGIVGTVAIIRIDGLLPNVKYILQALCGTAKGNRLSLFSHIPTDSPF